jgi:eukaryotic-like serine/threonine-protein kinase
MSKPPPPGGTIPSVPDDAITVPRVRLQDLGGEPSAIVIPSADLKTMDPSAIAIPSADLKTMDPSAIAIPSADLKTMDPSAVLLSGSDLKTMDPSAILLSGSDLKTMEPSAIAVPGSERKTAGPGSSPLGESLVGKVISDRYLVHELIGHGGMGAVYRGEQVHLRKRVAIKVLQPDKARMAELAIRFEREAIAGAHVDHPNVVAATDFGKLEDGSQFLILEYVEGTPLNDLLEKGPLPLERALSISRQIVQALAAVHDKSIVHRDVKPQNILIADRDQVKLLDFGLAKVRVELLSDASRNAKPGPALTAKGVVMGTFAYMAPETLRGMEAVDARSDLFALGVVMYEMLTGKRPFDEKEPVRLFKQVCSEDAPPMRLRAPEANVPPRIEAIVMKLLEREPDRRFGSANELCAALDEATATLGKESAKEKETEAEKVLVTEPAGVPPRAPEVAATKPAASPPKPASTPPDKRVLVWLAAGFSALAVILFIVLLATRSSSKPDEEVTLAPTVSAAPPAPTATATATAAPANVPTEIDGANADEWAERLKIYAGRKEWRPGAKALLALGQLDPARLTGRDLRTEVSAIVAGIGFETSFAESDQVFDALENQLGSGGLDVLFHVVLTRGGTKGSRRASAILSKPETLARATPALRIAIELRKANCVEKRALFARAVEEGDERALHALMIARDARCSNKRDPCCFREDSEIADAILKLRTRLGQ